VLALNLQRVRRIAFGGNMRTGLGGLAAALAVMASSGCSSGGWFLYVNPTSSPAFTAFIRPASVGISGAIVTGPLQVPCDVVIAASRTVDLQEVTIRMTDGSNLGGPTVTFPQSQLSSQFGSTRVVAGATQAFTLPCMAAPSFGTVILIGYVSGVDSSARVHRVTVERTWP
jgi:hypothetical protein